MKKLRVLALVPEGSVPPPSMANLDEKSAANILMEWDVVTSLKRSGHTVECLGVHSELAPIREAIERFKPHIVFNMLEAFHGFVAFDHNVVSYLELLRVPYTGCNPRGLVLARDKALTKKIMTYHRIRGPGFAVFPGNRRPRRVKRLTYPLLVKSLIEEASTGISQASLVHNDEQLAERVRFVHDQFGDAIAEEYIEGREIYLGILGNHRLTTFPVREMVFQNLPEGAPRIATARVKSDPAYQEKYGITTRQVPLATGLADRIARVGKRIYRLLGLSGYARLDFRLRDDGAFFLLEANPNPDLKRDEDFALSAKGAGLGYSKLLEKIVTLDLTYHRSWYE